MGKILRFRPHHARASSGCEAAKASKVISPQPTSSAGRTKSAQRRGGIPRARQVLTVDNGTPNFSATTLVPPSASIAKSEVSIPRTIVRSPRTSQAPRQFADCEATSDCVYDGIGPMAETLKDISRRLELTRIALGFESQISFCKEIRVQKNVYNPFETGKRRITIDIAIKIRRRFGIPLDWIYCGDPASLPAHIYRKLGSAAA
jgi:DNA-binding XRE family transcriptional regulator